MNSRTGFEHGPTGESAINSTRKLSPPSRGVVPLHATRRGLLTTPEDAEAPWGAPAAENAVSLMELLSSAKRKVRSRELVKCTAEDNGGSGSRGDWLVPESEWGKGDVGLWRVRGSGGVCLFFPLGVMITPE